MGCSSQAESIGGLADGFLAAEYGSDRRVLAMVLGVGGGDHACRWAALVAFLSSILAFHREQPASTFFWLPPGAFTKNPGMNTPM